MGPGERAPIGDIASRERGAAPGRAAAPPDDRRHARLLRRYFVVSALLLAGGLLTSGLGEMYFRYHEIRENIALLQQEAAAGAAFKIGQFVQEVQGALTAASRSREVIAEGLGHELLPLRQYVERALAGDLERLLLVAPGITEVIALDTEGHVRARVSRLRPIHPEGRLDFSGSPAFREAREGRVHVGPVHRTRDAEPHLTLAVPIERLAGEVIGVLQAEISLIYLGEHVVSRLLPGDSGYAYLLSRSGELLAHPQVKRVLEQHDLTQLEHVRAALGSAPADAGSRGTLARSATGERVFSSHAAVPHVSWVVFIERPADEVYRPLFASIWRTAVLLLVALGLALAVSGLVARRILRPLETLRQGVERIGRGDLTHRLEVQTGDELQALAEEFNRMSARLQEAYTGLEQKVAERTRELVALNQQLDQANRLKSQFLANVSHEFRTPMNAIIGFTRLVMRKTEGQIPALQHANLQKVIISAEHLLALINGLLDLSKIEAGRMEVSPVAFDLKELVHGAAATIEPMLKADRVSLTIDVDPDLPVLRTDREKLRQILMNLLSNAAKFTDAGVISVSARRTGDQLALTVADTGVGMPADALEYIFEEFRQVDMSSTRRHGGTGLGLAIVRRLAHLLGGRVSAESALGRGSSFTVTIPLALDHAGAPAVR